MRLVLSLLILSFPFLSSAQTRFPATKLFRHLALIEEGHSLPYTLQSQQHLQVLERISGDIKSLAQLPSGQLGQADSDAAKIVDELYAHLSALEPLVHEPEVMKRVLPSQIWQMRTAQMNYTVPAVWRYVTRHLTPDELKHMETIFPEAVGFLRDHRGLRHYLIGAVTTYVQRHQGWGKALKMLATQFSPEEMKETRSHMGREIWRKLTSKEGVRDASSKVFVSMVLTVFQRELRSPSILRCKDSVFD